MLVLDVYPNQRKLRNIYWFRLGIFKRPAKPWIYTDGLIIQSFKELGDCAGIFLRFDLIFTLLLCLLVRKFYPTIFTGHFNNNQIQVSMKVISWNVRGAEGKVSNSN